MRRVRSALTLLETVVVLAIVRVVLSLTGCDRSIPCVFGGNGLF